jgi:hypothetical protein
MGGSLVHDDLQKNDELGSVSSSDREKTKHGFAGVPER